MVYTGGKEEHKHMSQYKVCCKMFGRSLFERHRDYLTLVEKQDNRCMIVGRCQAVCLKGASSVAVGALGRGRGWGHHKRVAVQGWGDLSGEPDCWNNIDHCAGRDAPK